MNLSRVALKGFPTSISLIFNQILQLVVDLECHCTNWVKVETFPQKIEDLQCTDSPNVCSLFLQANGDLALFICGISGWDWL